MDSRLFNTVITPLHHFWAADLLYLQVGPKPNKGPDLIGYDRIIECKFAAVQSKGRKEPIRWTVDEEQMSYPDEYHKGYWGLGIFWFAKEIKQLDEVSTGWLEKWTLRREMYLVNWEWMNQFKPSKGKSGKLLRTPQIKYLPPTYRSYEVNKGLIHLTEGVNPNSFQVNGDPLTI